MIWSEIYIFRLYVEYMNIHPYFSFTLFFETTSFPSTYYYITFIVAVLCLLCFFISLFQRNISLDDLATSPFAYIVSIRGTLQHFSNVSFVLFLQFRTVTLSWYLHSFLCHHSGCQNFISKLSTWYQLLSVRMICIYMPETLRTITYLNFEFYGFTFKL